MSSHCCDRAFLFALPAVLLGILLLFLVFLCRLKLVIIRKIPFKKLHIKDNKILRKEREMRNRNLVIATAIAAAVSMPVSVSAMETGPGEMGCFTPIGEDAYGNDLSESSEEDFSDQREGMLHDYDDAGNGSEYELPDGEEHVMTGTIRLKVGESKKLPKGWSEGHSEGYSEGYSEGTSGSSYGIGPGIRSGNNYSNTHESGLGDRSESHSESWSIGGAYEWESEDDAVAEVRTVDEHPCVIGRSAGTVEVTGYTDGEIRAVYTVIVTEEQQYKEEGYDENEDGESLNRKTLLLDKGGTVTLPAGWAETHTDIYGPSFDLDAHSSGWTQSGKYEWKSEDEDIAEIRTVDGKVCAVGIKEGTVDIIGYTDGKEKARYTAIVREEEQKEKQKDTAQNEGQENEKEPERSEQYGEMY